MAASLREIEVTGHERVFECRDLAAGLHALVAIHDTTLGPAVGGTRMYPYASAAGALEDVLRLARAMTYKAAAAQLPFGGGKAVIIGDPARDKSERLLRAFGECLEALGGTFRTGEDSGTTAADMEIAARETRYAIFPRDGGEGRWETASLTALGVFHGLQAAAREARGDGALAGLHVTLQGLGKVGEPLARLLAQAGARLSVGEPRAERLAALARDVAFDVVAPERLLAMEADALCPCALGGVLDDAASAQLRCRIVAGAANNQLATGSAGRRLFERGVVYAPDYVINAGGLISALYEMGRETRDQVVARTRAIHDRLLAVFARSHAEGVPPAVAADRMAEERLRSAARAR